MISAAVAALIVSAIAVVFYLEMQPPQVTVSEETFSVRAGVYGSEVSLSSLSSVTLEDQLPRIRLRTNGFALGGTLRGHFRPDELGDGELYIEAGSPPYVLVRTPDDYVIVNFREPEHTRELYELLRRKQNLRREPGRAGY